MYEMIETWAPIVISAGVLFYTAYSIHLQRVHNRLSVRPMICVTVGDYEDQLSVGLVNKGKGPGTIRRLRAGEQKMEDVDLFIDLLPKPPHPWSNFASTRNVSVLAPSETLILFEINIDESDSQQTAFRDAMRHKLKTMKIEVEYEDLYKRKMPKSVRLLDWFGRS